MWRRIQRGAEKQLGKLADQVLGDGTAAAFVDARRKPGEKEKPAEEEKPAAPIARDQLSPEEEELIRVCTQDEIKQGEVRRALVPFEANEGYFDTPEGRIQLSIIMGIIEPYKFMDLERRKAAIQGVLPPFIRALRESQQRRAQAAEPAAPAILGAAPAAEAEGLRYDTLGRRRMSDPQPDVPPVADAGPVQEAEAEGLEGAGPEGQRPNGEIPEAKGEEGQGRPEPASEEPGAPGWVP